MHLAAAGLAGDADGVEAAERWRAAAERSEGSRRARAGFLASLLPNFFTRSPTPATTAAARGQQGPWRRTIRPWAQEP